MALTPYSPFFLSGLITDQETSYLDFAENQSLYSYPSLKRKPSSLHSEIQPPRLRHRSSECSLRDFPSPKPEPSSPLPPQPLATSTNRPFLMRKASNISTVPSSYKRRKRTDALAALEGRRPLPSDSHKNFMSMSDDEDEEELDPDAEAAEFYGRQVSILTEARSNSTGLSSFSFGFKDRSAFHLISTLDLTEDQVLPPPSPRGQLATKPVIPKPVPKLAMPSPPKTKKPKTSKANKASTSFLPLSPTSTSSSSTGPKLPLQKPTPVTSSSKRVPKDVPSPAVPDLGWKAISIESPFLPPFTFEDIDIDFSLPPRPAPSPDLYSPPPRPARRSEDDLPVQSELAFRQFEAAARAALASPNKSSANLTRSGSRTRTISSPSRSSSRRPKKVQRQALNAMSSFIEFDLRSSISSKPSNQSMLHSYWKDPSIISPY